MEQQQEYERLCKAVLDVLPALAVKVEAERDAQVRLWQLLIRSLADSSLATEEPAASKPENNGLLSAAEENCGGRAFLPGPHTEAPICAELLGEMQSLRREFEERLRYDTYKETLFDKMHQELTAFRNRALEKPTDRMALDIVSVVDNLESFLRNLTEPVIDSENKVTSAPQILHELQGVRTDLLDILYKNGVEPFTCGGPELDPKRQKVISSELDAEIPEEARVIIHSQKPGYEREGYLLRKEQVKVIKLPHHM